MLSHSCTSEHHLDSRPTRIVNGAISLRRVFHALGVDGASAGPWSAAGILACALSETALELALTEKWASLFGVSGFDSVFREHRLTLRRVPASPRRGDKWVSSWLHSILRFERYEQVLGGIRRNWHCQAMYRATTPFGHPAQESPMLHCP